VAGNKGEAGIVGEKEREREEKPCVMMRLALVNFISALYFSFSLFLPLDMMGVRQCEAG
jgi:hypothetical protein